MAICQQYLFTSIPVTDFSRPFEKVSCCLPRGPFRKGPRKGPSGTARILLLLFGAKVTKLSWNQRSSNRTLVLVPQSTNYLKLKLYSPRFLNCYLTGRSHVEPQKNVEFVFRKPSDPASCVPKDRQRLQRISKFIQLVLAKSRSMRSICSGYLLYATSSA